ncbi:MAG: N-acetyl-gamma-glutamyl-phosphate reductase [Cyanothece sp. SIO2G6]|nr:N-acetyl-gamma-glutamyl-phosphate reductase [Cyanothece sp. SIO2G6]
MSEPERIRVGIAGVASYPGVQLVRLLLSHPQVELVYLGDRQHHGRRISELYPDLHGYFTNKLMTKLKPVEAELMGQACQFVFLAEAHGNAWTLAPVLLKSGCKVIDLSADYRFGKLDLYKAWYRDVLSSPRTDQTAMQQAVYGLPELYRDRLQISNLVGCPGCYPTAGLLAIAPLFKHGLVVPESTIIDAKCGLSEGGIQPKKRLLFAEADQSVAAYAVSRHRATPEIEQVCNELAGHHIAIQFVPHRVPTVRGLLTTVYATLRDPGLVRDDLLTIYQVFYRASKWVKVLPNGTYPQTKWTTGTNFCHIGIETDQRSGRVMVISALDNLLKGQAGQAIQCMNIMMGWDEMVGLPKMGLYP